ncbi:MAG: DoxX family membrane protein [Ignavibacteriales bacterium]|nr:DoxX family membrane protein [Ignavibacteriales bacterium]
MMKLLEHKYTIFLSRTILGLVFVVASVDKIALPELFASNIHAYGLVPFSFVNIFALIIPWVELLCGLFLLGGFRVRASALLLSVLTVVFIIAISSAIFKGLEINCGCFGASKSSIVGWDRVVEDIGLLLLSLHLIFLAPNSNQTVTVSP